MKSAEVRDELIRALRLDLIGPDPGSAHEREELPHEPSRWYVGGFLVPFEAPEEQRVDPTGQEELFAAGDENGAEDADVPERASARATMTEDGSCREVATEWVPTAAVEKVEPTRLEGVELGMEALAAMGDAEALVAALAAFPVRYGEWIARQRETKLEGKRAEAVTILLDEGRHACGRIERGIAILREPEVFKAFQVANRAMARAARRRSARGRNVPPEAVDAPAWFPFQLAFLLMNLEGIARPASAGREAVDLLFFPTGGGKTEAYLGLAAFTMVLRRLRNPGLSSAGVAVLMRYTLRLLTVDQLGRVATLVCALELEREADTALGPWPFEVGLWVGRAATPNRMGAKGDDDETTARTKTLRYKQDSRRWAPPIPLESCPWCAAAFSKDSFSLLPTADRPTDLRVVCVNRKCDFKGDRPLPILTVDEPIYRRLPAFLIATVDKLASLPWVGEVGALFGKVDRHDRDGFYGPCDPGRGTKLEKALLPPELIIQDELHLISGPLGTIAGLYEIAVDRLASREEAGKRISPKVVASTATIRRAEAQVRALFGRSAVYVFPPPGPDRRDSFFARTVSQSEKEPRTYVGLSAQGRSLKVLLLRSYLALLGASQRLYEEAGGPALGEKNPADPYLTLVGYFSSLRELGGTRRIVEDEVAARAARYGGRRRVGEEAGAFRDRAIQQEVVELTSRGPGSS